MTLEARGAAWENWPRRCLAITRSTNTFTARPLHEVITENATRGLWMLLAATSLLLLIACTNVANLLLARAVVRERDLAIRASLGAGRRRLFGQVMGETVALGILGSVVGIGLAWGILRVFAAGAGGTSRGSPPFISMPTSSASR